MRPVRIFDRVENLLLLFQHFQVFLFKPNASIDDRQFAKVQTRHVACFSIPEWLDWWMFEYWILKSEYCLIWSRDFVWFENQLYPRVAVWSLNIALLEIRILSFSFIQELPFWSLHMALFEIRIIPFLKQQYCLFWKKQCLLIWMHEGP